MTSAYRLGIALLTCCLLAPGIDAASMDLRQDGWAFGGPLTLSFNGEDENLDGSVDRTELVRFDAIFQLSPGHSTSWSLADIQPDGFFFTDPGNFVFFVTNAEYSLVDAAFEGETLASVFDQSLFFVDESQSAVQVVPEPAGLAWLGLVCIGLVRFWRQPNRG
jgi:hypothetical protein